MLCKAGIADMAELLDPNGVWTAELLELMLPVVIDMEADAATAAFGASAAAVSLLGGKRGAMAFEAGVKKTKQAARDMMRKSRGLPPERPEQQLKAGETPADQFLSLMGQMGLRPHKRPVKGKPQATRKHKGT